MNTWIIIWFIFWIGGMGLPNYLFKKHNISYYERPWQHVIFFTFISGILSLVYKDVFAVYFSNFSIYHLLVIIILFLLWFLVPIAYKNDYYSKKERLHYQLPKFFEVVFQQICFLGGLLTFGVTPAYFGFIFFLVHIPMFLFVPKKFALVPIVGSLVGGLVIAYLQAQGTFGFVISLFIHLLFWASVHYVLSEKNFLRIVPVKR